MRMIDHFRTPSQQKIIRWLETNRTGTAAMMSKDLFDNRIDSSLHNHLKNLIDDGVIHICGYVGYRNQKVYELVRRSVRNPSDRSQAQGGVLKHESH